jgi:hypothetical protein
MTDGADGVVCERTPLVLQAMLVACLVCWIYPCMAAQIVDCVC